MSDFNSDNAKLDAALKAHSDAIAGKAAQSTVSALTQTVNAKANQSDLTALTQTVSGKASQADLNSLTQTVDGLADQVGLRGNCRIYYTTYAGNGQTSRTLTFPGKPLLVIAQGDNMILRGVYGNVNVMCRSNGQSGEICDAVWGSNSLTWSFESPFYGLNETGQTYQVVALMAADE